MSYFDLNLLAFGAHPDDIEFCCSGLFCLLKRKSYKTGIVDLTRAELSTRGTLESRAQETEAASQLMGLSVRENLDLPDGWIHPYSMYDEEDVHRSQKSALVKVVASIRKHRPEILLIPYQLDKHPDHEATSVLLTKAVFLAGLEKFKTPQGEEPFIPKQVLYFQMRYAFHPSFILDISNVFEEKLRVIECYKTQIIPIPDPAHPISRCAVNAIEAKDRHYGTMIGAEFGEPFFMRNTLGMTDPIQYFRENNYCKPNFFDPKW